MPPPERPDYRKWVRFYFDFCHKYGQAADSPASRGPFLAKLASMNQSVAQRSQASAAVGLLLQSAAGPRATPPLPAAAPAHRPPRPPGGDGQRTRAQVQASLSAVQNPAASQIVGRTPPTRGLPEPPGSRPTERPAAPAANTASKSSSAASIPGPRGWLRRHLSAPAT